jgi:cellulose biosynthesis protein BcsQ
LNRNHNKIILKRNSNILNTLLETIELCSIYIAHLKPVSPIILQEAHIIFDCPPATKIVSLNAIAASHGYILPVVPEAVMERGAPHLAGMIRTGIDAKLKALAMVGTTAKRSMHVADTKLVGLVITRLKHTALHTRGIPTTIQSI